MGHLRLAVVLGAAGLLIGCASPGDQDKKNLQAGFASYSQRQYGPAERAGATYIEKFPNDQFVDEAYYLRGIARQGLGNRAGAEKDLKDAIAKTDRADLKSKAHRALADAEYEQQRWEAAIAKYREAIAAGIGPDSKKPLVAVDSMVYERLGASLQALGKWDDARPVLDQALAARPDAAGTHRITARRAAKAFELQFGVFADSANARAQIESLKKAGMLATIASEMRDGKVMWAVRSGSFKTMAEAEGARKKAGEKKVSAVVVP